MYSFIFTLLLLVSISALTTVPTPDGSSPTGKPTPQPTLKPTPVPTFVSSPTTSAPTPGTTAGSSPTGKPTPDPTSNASPGTVPTQHRRLLTSTVPTPDGTSPTGKPTPQPTGKPTPDPTLKPTPQPTSKPTPDPTLKPTPSPVTGTSTVPTQHRRLLLSGALSRCIATNTSLDIIFMVDSSGSVWDQGYQNWENELQLVYDIIQNTIPTNSRIGLINFSGCGSGYSLDDCKNLNRLKQMISLTEYGSPNDLAAVLSFVNAIDEDDFNGGATWTNEALQMALDEFNANSQADYNKMIVLITDGIPYPQEEAHEPCKVSTNYTSTTLQSLRALGVSIITIGIDVDTYAKDEYFDCISSDDFYFEATFDSQAINTNAVKDLSESLGDFICSELGSTRMIVPTIEPTPSPVYGIGSSPKPTKLPSPSPTTSPVSVSETCSSSTELDIIFMVDSSGSVFDDGYINWQSELDLVYNIVNTLPDASTRVSLINFSGCASQFSLTQCEEQGRLKTVFGLNTYGYNLESVSGTIGEMGPDDFNGGYTWTNQALGLALDQFNSNSDDDKTKIIVLLTDGEPYPYDNDHEPCLSSTNYKSTILTSLEALNVDIITVGIDISEEMKEEKLDCISSEFFGVSQFSTLQSLSVQIGELICDKIDGDFSTISLVPTPSPVTNVHATSNGIKATIYINLMAIISGILLF